jgi:two-component system, cell cycle response regulator
VSLATQHSQLAARRKLSFLIGFIDLDGMKHINDTFGHQEGNHALVETAAVLRNSFRQSDILARYGGDEFAVLISDAAETSTETVIDRVQEQVGICNAQPGRRYQLSLSIGIASNKPGEVASIEQLLHVADALMYQCKQTRRESRELTLPSTRTS